MQEGLINYHQWGRRPSKANAVEIETDVLDVEIATGCVCCYREASMEARRAWLARRGLKSGLKGRVEPLENLRARYQVDGRITHMRATTAGSASGENKVQFFANKWAPLGAFPVVS